MDRGVGVCVIEIIYAVTASRGRSSASTLTQKPSLLRSDKIRALRVQFLCRGFISVSQSLPSVPVARAERQVGVVCVMHSGLWRLQVIANPDLVFLGRE